MTILHEEPASDPFAKTLSLDRWALNQAEIRALASECRRNRCLAEIRVAFAGDVVLDPLSDYFIVHLGFDNIRASTYIVPFGQIMQELLEPNSGLQHFKPDYLYMHFETDVLLRGFEDRREFETADHRRVALAEIVELVKTTVAKALQKTSGVVLISNFAPPPSYALGLADFRSEYSEQQFYSDLNLSLCREFRTNHRVQIVDFAALIAWHGVERALDRRLFQISKIPWQHTFFHYLADLLARHVSVSQGRVRKCVAVDLDNTLWRGVLGEEGPLGVQVGVGDPQGEGHLQLQRTLIDLKRRGVLLAICSKNNPEDVEEVFRVRSDLPLRISDFACTEIGWNPKHKGLREIARRLGIGTESLLFLDDDPAEIALVRQMLPEVECILAPADSALLASCLIGRHSLDRVAITAEDVMKDRQYSDSEARRASRADFGELRDYLFSLQTSVQIKFLVPDLIPRANQLFQKTNQFNLTGRRYTLSDLEQATGITGARVLMVHASDRFGDMGWVGAAMLRVSDDNCLHIDNLVLSCRALGRGIELPLLAFIYQIAFEQDLAVAVTAEFRPSKKNAQVCSLFDGLGFQNTKIDQDGAKHYWISRKSAKPSDCGWITVRTS